MLRNHLRNSTTKIWYFFMDCSTWLKKFSIPNLGRGPAGRGLRPTSVPTGWEPLLYYSEAIPTTARILHQSFTLKRTGR